MIHCVLHDPNDSVAVVVVEGVKAGTELTGLILDEDRTITLPARAQPAIRYAFCIVRRRGGDAAAAQAFVNRVRSPRGRVVLQAAGFGLPRG